MQSNKERKRILSKKGEVVLEGRFRLYVTPDGLEAYLRREKKEGASPDLNDEDLPKLKEELKKIGIINGILSPPKKVDDVIIVAQGTPPQDGEDARLEPKIDLKKGPKEIDGKIDYREVNAIVSVKAQQVILEKIPPTPGKPGKDVFGDTLPAKPGKDIKIKHGDGLKLSKDGLYLIAEKDGVILQEGETLKLISVYHLNGDVNWDIGNVYFRGEKLFIHGDIKSGFKIICKGDLEIDGRIENGAKIVAYGELIIKGLVQGDEIVIVGKKDAYISVIEYSKVFIKKNLYVDNYILSAFCRIGGDLKAKRIISGESYIRGSVFVDILGCEAQILTVIKAAYDKLLEKKIKNIEHKLAMYEDILIKLQKTIRIGEKLIKSKKLNKKQLMILEKISKRYKDNKCCLLELKEKKEKLVKRKTNFQEAVVKVKEKVYPGTIVWITDRSFTVVKPMGSGIFLRKKNQILFRTSSL